MRLRLLDRVLEFAQAQFDAGLYALARNEFDLAERLLTVTEADRPLTVNVESYYREHPGPMVILGHPGTGKTTLLYELATAVCSRRDAEAVPVPFGLSHWAMRQEALDDWLVSELRRSYGVGSALARSWVDKEVVVPFLDGLDEVPLAMRGACVAKIKEYQRKHPDVKFVVTCREADYRDLKEGIGISSGIVARTLSRERVEGFLAAHSGKLRGLQEALRAEPAMWELMDTPLMLWVAAFAFQEGRPAVAGGVARGQLFDRYLDAMLKRGRGETIRFGLAEVKHWLRQTAACLNRAGLYSFHLEDLSAAWLPPARQATAKRVFRWTLVLVCGLVVGLAVGLKDGLKDGLIGGLLGGWLGTLIEDTDRPVDLIRWSWKDGLVGLPLALACGLTCGLAGGLEGGLTFGLTYGVAGGLFFGMVFGLVFGLVPARFETRSSVNSGLKRSGRFAILVGLPYGIALVLTALYLRDVPIFNLTFAVAVFGFVGLPLMKGGGFCAHNLSIRAVLASGKYIPWRCERFLYFAVDNALMIRQGGSFRFIHRMMQEHLAAQADPTLERLNESSAENRDPRT